MCMLYFLHNLRWNKTHPLSFQCWKEMSFWKGIEDLNIVSLIWEIVTRWCHQNTTQYGTFQITLMPLCDLCMVCITEEQDFLIFIFQCLGQRGSLGGVIMLQIQSTSIIFNLLNFISCSSYFKTYQILWFYRLSHGHAFICGCWKKTKMK